VRWLFACAIVLTFVACGGPSTGPSPTSVELISGQFDQRPWVQSRFYFAGSQRALGIDVTFYGDYNDQLWIDVMDGDAVISRTIAKGYFDPRKHVDVQLPAGKTYELRIWTDKCCTHYDGIVSRTS
jgi:hypothetical protein